jgi:hypothetical protein
MRKGTNTSNISRGSRASSQASNYSNLSFMSSNRGGSKRKDRNRFFSPKAIKDLPPITP